MKCVGIALYNPEEKLGGLGHLDGENIRAHDGYLQGTFNSQQKLSDLQEFVKEVSGKTSIGKLRATIVSGSAPQINYIREFFKILGITKIDIQYNEQWGSPDNSFFNKNLPKGSLALDCKTGNVFSIQNHQKVLDKMGIPPVGDKLPKPFTKQKFDK